MDAAIESLKRGTRPWSSYYSTRPNSTTPPGRVHVAVRENEVEEDWDC